MSPRAIGLWLFAVGVGPDWVSPRSLIIEGKRISSAGWFAIAWDYELERWLTGWFWDRWDNPRDRFPVLFASTFAAIWACLSLATFVADRAGWLPR